MASKTILEKRLTFRTKALEKLYDAYTALVDGGVKSYMIALIFRRCPRRSKQWRARSTRWKPSLPGRSGARLLA